ncbi:MAG: hypothetical protein GX240_04495 [Candidatus Atribacteria bacterium]|nr:hypothetical protein [Candidatus Atribacteria bacterium]
MSIKDIKERILRDALKEKERILRDTKIRIEELKSQDLKENESIRRDIMERYKQEAELKEKKIVTEARLNAKKSLLAEKQDIINNIFSEVIKRIMKFDDLKYMTIIENLILENVETGDETVYVGEQERDSINQEFINKINKKLQSLGKKGDLRFSKERLPIIGGVVIGTGQIKKNSSLEVLLEKIKDELETKLNRFLFENNEG